MPSPPSWSPEPFSPLPPAPLSPLPPQSPPPPRPFATCCGGPGVLCGGPGVQFVMRMRPRAHVQTTSTSARHGVMMSGLRRKAAARRLIVVLVMARRHLTSVHRDGPEAPKACPRIARQAS